MQHGYNNYVSDRQTDRQTHRQDNKDNHTNMTTQLNAENGCKRKATLYPYLKLKL